MSTMTASRKQARAVIIIFLLVNSLLLASVALYPFIDLPNHLAEATIFKYYEPGNLLSQYYSPTPWYFPNTFHTVFCSLFPSVEWGNKAFHILYIVALQLSIFLVIARLNGNPWYGLLAVLFSYNYNVTFGFVGFAVSIPTLILLFYVILIYTETEKKYLNLIIAALLVLLFFMHAQNALMGLAMYGVMLLYHYRTSLWKLVLHVLVIPVPLLLLIFTWWFTRAAQKEEASTLDYLKDYYSNAYLQEFPMRFRIIVFDNFQLREGMPGLIIASLFFLCLFIPLIALRKRSMTAWTTWRSPGVIYAGILFTITFLCYMLVPDKLPGQTPIFQRFCTIVILAFIILISIVMNQADAPWIKYFVLASMFSYMLLWTEYIVRFNNENAAFNEGFFEGVAPGNRLAGLIYENQYRGRKVYIHFPNYFIVWNQGIAASKIIDYRFGVVRRVAPESRLPFYDELIGEHYAIQPQYAIVDLLLVRGEAPVADDQNLKGFQLYRKAGNWELYKKK